MSVRAVTPRLPALHGHTYVHPADCPGDCCNWDAFTDDLATGEPFDTDYRPPMGRGVHKFVKGAHAGRAQETRSGATRVMPAAPPSAGPDGRGSGSSLPDVAGTSLPATNPAHVGRMPGSLLAEPDGCLSSQPSGREAPEAQNARAVRPGRP